MADEDPDRTQLGDILQANYPGEVITTREGNANASEAQQLLESLYGTDPREHPGNVVSRPLRGLADIIPSVPPTTREPQGGNQVRGSFARHLANLPSGAVRAFLESTGRWLQGNPGPGEVLLPPTLPGLRTAAGKSVGVGRAVPETAEAGAEQRAEEIPVRPRLHPSNPALGVPELNDWDAIRGADNNPMPFKGDLRYDRLPPGQSEAMDFPGGNSSGLRNPGEGPGLPGLQDTRGGQAIYQPSAVELRQRPGVTGVDKGTPDLLPIDRPANDLLTDRTREATGFTEPWWRANRANDPNPTEFPYYHPKGDINEVGGVFMAPTEAEARIFGKHVQPYYVRSERPLRLDRNYSPVDPADAKLLKEKLGLKGQDIIQQAIDRGEGGDQLREALKGLGYDSVDYLDEEGKPWSRAVFDPKNIRHRDAEYDPAKANQSGLFLADQARGLGLRAAFRVVGQDGKEHIFTGDNHGLAMEEAYNALGPEIAGHGSYGRLGGFPAFSDDPVQGFVGKDGKYLTRREAAELINPEHRLTAGREPTIGQDAMTSEELNDIRQEHGKDLYANNQKASVPGAIIGSRYWDENVPTTDASGVGYHGSKNDITGGYDLRRAGKSDPGLVGKGMYITPDREQAGQFAMSPHYGGKGDAPNVTPVQYNFKNPAIVQDGVLPDGRTLTDAHPRGITKESAAALNRDLIKAGYDGVIFKSGNEVQQVAALKRGTVNSDMTGTPLFADTKKGAIPGVLFDAERPYGTDINPRDQQLKQGKEDLRALHPLDTMEYTNQPIPTQGPNPDVQKLIDAIRFARGLHDFDRAEPPTKARTDDWDVDPTKLNADTARGSLLGEIMGAGQQLKIDPYGGPYTGRGYHGMNGELKGGKFDKKKFGRNFPEDAAGVFLTSEPVDAGHWADAAGLKGRGEPAPAIVPADVNFQNPLRVQTGEKHPTQYWYDNRRLLAQIAKNHDSDGVVLTGGGKVYGGDRTTIVALKKKTLTSPHSGERLYYGGGEIPPDKPDPNLGNLPLRQELRRSRIGQDEGDPLADFSDALLRRGVPSEPREQRADGGILDGMTKMLDLYRMDDGGKPAQGPGELSNDAQKTYLERELQGHRWQDLFNGLPLTRAIVDFDRHGHEPPNRLTADQIAALRENLAQYPAADVTDEARAPHHGATRDSVENDPAWLRFLNRHIYGPGTEQAIGYMGDIGRMVPRFEPQGRESSHVDDRRGDQPLPTSQLLPAHLHFIYKGSMQALNSPDQEDQEKVQGLIDKSGFQWSDYALPDQHAKGGKVENEPPHAIVHITKITGHMPHASPEAIQDLVHQMIDMSDLAWTGELLKGSKEHERE